ncbi:hypothetical protein RCR19_37025 [Streptomyces sp. WAC07094]|uniref:hypothetical protein n=1 Tax=Streptomyces sp. WAC07094 TaxID=3072183 RepID=UPI002EB1B911|nr:hypothetical protein [Streptomyces sp. WAC07094]
MGPSKQDSSRSGRFATTSWQCRGGRTLPPTAPIDTTTDHGVVNPDQAEMSG